MRLHNAWIDDAIIGSRNVNIARRLLHNDGENHTSIDSTVSSDLSDSIVHGVDRGRVVVEFESRYLQGPQVIETHP